MNETPIQPLLWDGADLADQAACHPFADVYPEIVRLIGKLGECIDEGIGHWRRAAFRERRQLYPLSDPLCLGEYRELTDAEWDAYHLSGYRPWVQEAACSIFYGLGSAHTHAFRYSSFADAIRHHAFPSADSVMRCRIKRIGSKREPCYIIPDRLIYALAAACDAWWATNGLVDWLDAGMKEALDDFSLFDVPGQEVFRWIGQSPDDFDAAAGRPSAVDWFERAPDSFAAWARRRYLDGDSLRERDRDDVDRARRQGGQDASMTLWRIEAKLSAGRKRAAELAGLEAETRQYAAAQLGDARRLLMLASMADELSAATLGRLSLEAERQAADSARREVGDMRRGRSNQGRKAGQASIKYDDEHHALWKHVADGDDMCGASASHIADIIIRRHGEQYGYDSSSKRSIRDYVGKHLKQADRSKP